MLLVDAYFTITFFFSVDILKVYVFKVCSGRGGRLLASLIWMHQ